MMQLRCNFCKMSIQNQIQYLVVAKSKGREFRKIKKRDALPISRHWADDSCGNGVWQWERWSHGDDKLAWSDVGWLSQTHDRKVTSSDPHSRQIWPDIHILNLTLECPSILQSDLDVCPGLLNDHVSICENESLWVDNEAWSVWTCHGLSGEVVSHPSVFDLDVNQSGCGLLNNLGNEVKALPPGQTLKIGGINIYVRPLFIRTNTVFIRVWDYGL